LRRWKTALVLGIGMALAVVLYYFQSSPLGAGIVGFLTILASIFGFWGISLRDVFRKRERSLPEVKTVETSARKGEKPKSREEHRGAETVPLGMKETEGIVLLPDASDIARLSMSNDFLDTKYEEARRQAIAKYDDAQLCRFTVQVFPFVQNRKVNVYLDFYSKWADRLCQFRFSDTNPLTRHAPPDNRPIIDDDRVVFITLPWNKSPRWTQFISRVYQRIGALHPSDETHYQVSARPSKDVRRSWSIIFVDNFGGIVNNYQFSWTGAEIDDQNIDRRDY